MIFFNLFANIQFLLIIALAILVPFLIYTINDFLNQQKDYLNSLNSISLRQLKSDQGRLQIFNLIKNLSNMKKFIGISILLVTVVALLIASIIVYDSRNYFKEYFESQRNKLNLRSEASVDSLQNIIADQKTLIVNQSKLNDSLKVELKTQNEKLNLKNYLKECGEEVIDDEKNYYFNEEVNSRWFNLCKELKEKDEIDFVVYSRVDCGFGPFGWTTKYKAVA